MDRVQRMLHMLDERALLEEALEEPIELEQHEITDVLREVHRLDRRILMLGCDG